MDLSIIKNVPNKSGVYLFKDNLGDVLYVGKATDLKSRVSSYLRGGDSRGERIENMVRHSEKIDFIVADSVLEAVILEAKLIKKYQPKYNITEKDDKSFCYLAATCEKFPRILIIREKNLAVGENCGKRFLFSIGPFTSQKLLEGCLKIVRPIFPYHSIKENSEKHCLDFQIGKCPGPFAGGIDAKDYRKNILNIKAIFQGRKKYLLKKLPKEMEKASKNLEFERAGILKKQINALRYIADINLLGSRDCDKIA